MAEFRFRFPGNVPGRFYTDSRCLDCYFCRNTAPMVFRRDDTYDVSVVYHQPDTPEEIELCERCAAHCPCEAIGSDGEEHDWSIAPEPFAGSAPRARDLHRSPRSRNGLP